MDSSKIEQPTLQAKEDLAYEFVSRYADGGELCADCRYSDQSGPGSGHICLVLDGETRAHRPLDLTDCPALPVELYPD